MEDDKQPSAMARQTAVLILYLAMAGAGLAMMVSLVGDTTLGMQVCLGTIVLDVVVLLVGGLVIAANRE